jgi:hypothetical protein
MEEAIQSSIYVASPDNAGWLQKRGFAVSSNDVIDRSAVVKLTV